MKLSIFQVILLIVFGVLGVIGVLIFAFANTGGSSTSVGAVEIWGDIDEGAMNATLQQLADSNQDFAQVKYVKKDSATYETDLVNALASGSGPDLFVLRQDQLFQNAKRITLIPPESLPPEQFGAAFIDAADVFSTPRGALGVPILADPLVLYWNKDTLSANGYAKPPINWTEVQKMGERLQKRSDSGAIVKSAIALGEYSNVTNAKEIISALIIQAGGQVVAKDGTGNLVAGLLSGGTGSSQSAESALRYYTDFANPSKSHYSWNRSLFPSQKAFAAGDLALYLGFASEGTAIVKLNPNLNFAAAPIPQLPSGGRIANSARVYGVSISRMSQNQRGAAAVAMQFASPASGLGKSLSTAIGIPSPLRDVLALSSTGTTGLYGREVLISRTWYDPDPARTSEIFRAMIENITGGGLSISDTIQRANQEIGQLLKP